MTKAGQCKKLGAKRNQNRPIRRAFILIVRKVNCRYTVRTGKLSTYKSEDTTFRVTRRADIDAMSHAEEKEKNSVIGYVALKKY
ncbi:hypothetical protein T11_3681 [Trichinella zimbabwensis]|uniref:Uncharacterized protein n=1 Tax=Trichinella zimbabwensis TaxID=268475 RepID=A0A0V1H9J4_9BILA|nr:hypothetical protein T11_3681 [Trichinella zimbabwensis]